MSLLPWPRPLPAWFWPWVRWYLGVGEFVGKKRNMAYRPAGAPKTIPAWAWFRLKVHLGQEPDPRLPAPTPSDDALAFWRRMSFWVTRIDHFPPDYAEVYAEGVYKIIVVPCLWGVKPEAHTEGLAEYVKAMQAKGFKVAGSQWGEGINPITEADAALTAINKYGFDGWVMNGEKAYEGGGKSAAYIERFRSIRLNFPLGWSPEVRLDLDHAALQHHRVCYMPQVYPLEIPVATMPYAVEWADKFGYERKNVVPLVQAYTTDGVRYSAMTYREQAKFYGLPGLCLYTANQTVGHPEWWRALVV